MGYECSTVGGQIAAYTGAANKAQLVKVRPNSGDCCA